MRSLFWISLILLLSGALADDDEPQCLYTSTKGFTYNMGSWLSTAGASPNSGNDVSFVEINVCEPLPDSLCGSEVAVCVKDNSNQTRNYGSFSKVLYADLDPLLGEGVEVMFGDGDVCKEGQSSGSNRKTTVQFICDIDIEFNKIVSFDTDGCTTTIQIASQRACSANVYCEAANTSSTCETNDLCMWNEDELSCAPLPEYDCFHKYRLSLGHIFGFLLSVVALLGCFLGLCCCVTAICRKSSQNRTKMAIALDDQELVSPISVELPSPIPPEEEILTPEAYPGASSYVVYWPSNISSDNQQYYAVPFHYLNPYIQGVPQQIPSDSAPQ